MKTTKQSMKENTFYFPASYEEITDEFEMSYAPGWTLGTNWYYDKNAVDGTRDLTVNKRKHYPPILDIVDTNIWLLKWKYKNAIRHYQRELNNLK